MSDLDKRMLRLGALAIVLLVAVHFLLHERFGAEPKAGNLTELACYADLATVPLPGAAAGGGAGGPAFPMEAPTFDRPAFTPSFGARAKDVRLLLAGLNGGGEDTEKAVEAGLAYLAGARNADGSWGGADARPVASTGLAVCAFLGAGYHHMGGPYQAVVARGLDSLLAARNEAGRVGQDLYDTGIAGVAFTEAYGLTGDPRILKAARGVLAFLAKSQTPAGGWAREPYRKETGDRYTCDTSVTGCVLMAFRSAKLVGIAIPDGVLEKYGRYWPLVTNDQGMVAWQLRPGAIPETYTASMTAVTLLCRFSLLDTPASHLAPEGLAHLTTKLSEEARPAWTPTDNAMDPYLWHHAVQVAYRVGGTTWSTWNGMVMPLLVKNQIQNGERTGAWEDRYFKHGSRSPTYVTALNLLTLQTYYRYFR
jgi:hypothetical protein